MIKIKKDDSLSVIIRKIQENKKDEIFLQFPIGHGVLHDFNSLKILKKSFPNKKLVFITKDISTKDFLLKLGLSFSLIKDEEYLKKNLKKEKNLLKSNTSFGEYFTYELQKKLGSLKNRIQKKPSLIQNHSFPFLLVGTIFLISLLLLFFIFYLAVHKTYIYVNPEIEVVKIQRNFLFNNSTEFSLDDNTIKLREMSIESQLRDTFSSTNIEYESTKQASGEVVIYNELLKGISLIEGTRLISTQGIIYRIQKRSDIQTGVLGKNGDFIPGKTSVFVVADAFDEKGQFVGSRGNIEGEVLSIPGLDGEFKNRIYGKAQKINGGIDSYDVVVGEDDLEKASGLLRTKLEKEALKSLQEKIQILNTQNNENYSLLLSNNTLIYNDFSFNNSNGIKVGDKKRKFELDGSIKLKAYLYNKDFIFSRLKNIAVKRLIENNQELLHTDENSLTIAHMIYDRIDNQGKISIKATMEIEAYLRKNFDQKTYNSELLKNKIVGLEKAQAYDILLNNTNINKVNIKNSPFFMKKVSSKIENIFFKINVDKVNP